MKRMTLSVVVGMTALMILACYWGAASAQTNAGITAIGAATPGPFSLVRHGGGFHGGFGFGGWPGLGWGWGWPSYGSSYGSGYYDYPNYGTRTTPNQTCVWSGYEWKCYNNVFSY
ncbi:MAG: hypothetical protein ACLQPD_33675 [Desulfomonilaceae bacterium]